MSTLSKLDANSVVAESVLNTNSVSTNEVPAVCGGGYMENGGEFQRIIRSEDNTRTPFSESALRWWPHYLHH